MFFISWQSNGTIKKMRSLIEHTTKSGLRAVRRMIIISTAMMISTLALTFSVTMMIRITGREGTFYNIQAVNVSFLLLQPTTFPEHFLAVLVASTGSAESRWRNVYAQHQHFNYLFPIQSVSINSRRIKTTEHFACTTWPKFDGAQLRVVDPRTTLTSQLASDYCGEDPNNFRNF
jgi:hypothetical protein